MHCHLHVACYFIIISNNPSGVGGASEARSVNGTKCVRRRGKKWHCFRVCVCVSVCLSVYNFFRRTTGRILMSDSSFDRKCPREKTFTIGDIDFFRKSISIDRYIDFRSINVSLFDKFSNIAMLHIVLDQFWALNMNPAIFFRKSISIIDIDRLILIFDRSMYRFLPNSRT